MLVCLRISIESSEKSSNSIDSSLSIGRSSSLL